MAEFALKIGEGANYQDGDILCAFNRRFIRLRHADAICWPRLNGSKVGGQLENTQPLLEKWYQRIAQYMWERVSKHEIRRTNLWTLDEVVYGSLPVDDPDRPPIAVTITAVVHLAPLYRVTIGQPAGGSYLTDGAGRVYVVTGRVSPTVVLVRDRYAHGEGPVAGPGQPTIGRKIHCHVNEHYRGRNYSKKLPLFGGAGHEIEYGGRSKRDAATTELIWDDIEAATPLRRVDHDRMTLGEESPPTQITLEIGEDFRRRLKKLKRKEPFEVKYFGADRQDHIGIEGDSVMAILGGHTARECLMITVDDFDDETAEELVSPLMRDTGEVDEFGEPILERVKKRKHHVDWRSAATASLAPSIADIEDKTKRVDVRGAHTFQRTNIVLTKSL